jgi:hypothetical protein
MNPRIPIAILVLLLAACSKLTQENYDRLKSGMSYQEVKNILGAPSQCNEVLGIKACTWGDDKRYIKVNFVGNQVLLFSSQGLH